MLKEYSPDTPQGSITPDLNKCKLWLCRKLHELDLVKFDNIYVLGSWYGSMGLFLVNKHIKFNSLYNIDWDTEKTEYAAHVIKRMKFNNIHSVRADANEVEFVGDPILVINTSTNDIEGLDWLDNIPAGSLVALQGRDHQGDSNGIETIERFDRAYRLSRTLYLGTIVVKDYEGYPYLRFMKIGIK